MIQARQARSYQIQDEFRGGEDALEDAYPLSPMQQGMLYNALLDPGSGVDIEQIVVDLPEMVDITSFRCAWRDAMQRHAVLRTALRWDRTAQPLQEVFAQVDLPWQLLDWSEISVDCVQERTDRFLVEDRKRGFDLTRAPLFRLALLRIDRSRFRLVWSVHHAILDGRSFGLLLEDVFENYDARLRKREYVWPATRPYRDYIDWLHKDKPADDESFWRAALQGFLAPTPLVIDRVLTPIADSARKATVQATLTNETTERLRQLADSGGISLNIVVQGAWALLLHRYSGEEDIVFGAVRANRGSSVEGAEAMIGLFVNTLPMRVTVSQGATLVAWMQEIHRRWIEMRQHGHASLATIQTWSEVPAGLPLFHSTVMFDHQDLDGRMRQQSASRWSNRRIRTFSQTNYLLDLAAYGGDRLQLQIDFDRGRIDCSSATRMLGHLRTLLEGMADNPRALLGELPLLTQAEYRQLAVEWNDTTADYPANTLLHEMFERQCELTPDAVEVICGERLLTNRELEARSNQLARFLQGRGVGPDVLVAICLDRSLEMVIGILAILKAGGAYVPLDPALPDERVDHILAETKAPVVLTQVAFRGRFPADDGRAICLDSDWPLISREDARRPSSGAVAQNLAYVIYTSGSTGRPKGVMVSHAAICNHMHWMKRAHGLHADDVELQKAPFGFDASVWEFFAPLMSDAHLVMARPEEGLDPACLAEAIGAHRISTLQVVPSQLRMLLDEPEFRKFGTSLRRVYCGGEQLTRDLCEAFRANLPQATLYNMYGPTEGAIDSTCWTCPQGDIPDIVPIGKPIDNVRVYVVDPQMQLLPIGIPGELLVGGAGLARGYLNDPALTARRFLPDPFRPGGRVYRTGDRVRYLPDGNLEFLGRLDHQVKIRGFRIEPGEIEAIIAAHPDVKEAVVVAHAFAPDDVRLLAYAVSDNPPADLAEQLRSTVCTKMPDHMVPAHFTVLAAMPLTATGKVDRKALPGPHRSMLAESRYVAPRTPMEEALASTWRDVLQLERIGIHDDFFDLGGHSLLLARLVSRINLVYRVKLGVPDLIQNPTIEHLAKEIERQRPERSRLSSVVPMHEGAGETPVYFIYAGPSEFRIARQMGGDHPVFGIEARWPISWRKALSEGRVAEFPDMREMVAPYVAALHAHAGSTPCALAGLSYAGLIAFEAARQLKELGGNVEVVFLIDAQARPPSPYRLAWQTWRQDWKPSAAGVLSLLDIRGAVDRVKKSWDSTLWICGKVKGRLLAYFKPAEPDLETLTGVLDECGMPLPWGLMDRLYSEIDKTYRPLPLDCKGVLLRTAEIEGREIVAADDALGWENVFAQGLEIVPLAGNHYSIFGDQIPTIAREMNRVLNHAQSE
ncbi:MAG TPA: amino acid adenylation domain-containing protein [Burkholderiales bacterium]|nr:amino acid adenylation domain-containing protein [Burkholderiales bacterium]